MKLLAKAAAIAALGLSPAIVQADENPVVIELFTSQGCSSCPPADKILSDLAGRSDVLPLALHVDYWDYIGWKDDFAQPKFTQRQQQYAVAAGERTVYTPQFIVGGTDAVVGAHSVDLMAAVARHAAVPQAITLRADRDGATVTVSATTDASLPGRLVVQLVRFAPEQTVDIERGENAGLTITYSNVVTDWQKVEEWNGTEPLSLVLDLPGPEQAVVILQELDFGRIIAAALAD